MALAASVALTLAAGCAYSTRHALPAHIHSIAIPEFRNRTYSSDYARHIEVEVTEATRNAFIQTGELALAGRESADLILEGEINYVDREVLRSDRYGEAAEVKLLIKSRISVYDVKEAKYLIKDQVVTNIETTNENGTFNIRRGETENWARDGAVAKLGQAIAHAITERWPQSVHNGAVTNSK
jgi:hypothetical protein